MYLVNRRGYCQANKVLSVRNLVSSQSSPHLSQFECVNSKTSVSSKLRHIASNYIVQKYLFGLLLTQLNYLKFNSFHRYKLRWKHHLPPAVQDFSKAKLFVFCIHFVFILFFRNNNTISKKNMNT